MGSFFATLALAIFAACASTPSPVRSEASVEARPARQDPAVRRSTGVFDAAEKLYSDGSYELARRAFEELCAGLTAPADQRWCAFRVADSTWRALNASQSSDSSETERAQRELDALVRDVTLEAEQDATWALVHESLGDSYWTRRDSNDWGRAWPHYQAALSYWARSTDLETARRRYLDIVFRTATPSGVEGWRCGAWIYTPDELLQGAARIATTPEDRARVHLLRATTLQRRGGDWRSRASIAREFESALELGAEQPWYDDALFEYARWMESSGRIERDASGDWSASPDYVAALALYRRLADEFRVGESRWRDDALRAAQNITRAQLELRVRRHFLPNSEIAFEAEWRNVASIELSLYALDPLRHVALGEAVGSGEWQDSIALPSLERVKSWTHATDDDGAHRPSSGSLRVDGGLTPGAYLVVATAGGVTKRDVVLVTDAALVLEWVGDKALTWFVDARSGAPIRDAAVELWRGVEGGKWKRESAVSGADGLNEWKIAPGQGRRGDVLAFAKLGSRLAWASASSWDERSESGQWRVQVLTDRPTYRPEDVAHYKIVARRIEGDRYSTPAGRQLRCILRDGQGGERSNQVLELSEFGSASGELALDATMPLGAFTIELRSVDRNEWIASSSLFQLEEYKLPEFEVSVEPRKPEGRAGSWRAGDRVQARVRAQLYSGGAVANANVSVVISQESYWVRPPHEPEFAWLRSDDEYDASSRMRFGWGRVVVSEQTLVTDAAGEALVEFETPYDVANDFAYTIEARVTDASRREVVGSGVVHVGRQGHYVFARTTHNVHRTGEPIEFEFDATDADGAAVSVNGVVVFERLRWFRIWRDPRGEEIDEAEHARLAAAPDFDSRGWSVLRSGYKRERISTHPLSLDAKGHGALTLRPTREGCYSATWTSQDVDGAPVRSEASAWVADPKSSDLGWRRGDLEIVLDRDTLALGEEAVLLVTSSSGLRHVLLTVESETLQRQEVLELTGEAKLVRFPLDERSTPNVFVRVQAVSAGRWFADLKELSVPPVKQFLDVDVAPSSPDVRPGELCDWTIRAVDAAGTPVRAEVALAIVDEAVVAIAGDRAVDPRPFFYGRKRRNRTVTQSTMSERSFAKLGERDGVLVDLELALDDAEDVSEKSEAKLAFTESRRASVASGARMKDGSSNEAFAADALQAAPGVGGEIEVRSDFRATAYWAPAILTDESGRASVSLRMPQSFTRWRARAHAATAESRFGLGEGRATTSLPLTVRLQAPRFFVAGDTCVVSALVDNNTDEELQVVARIERDGIELGADLGASTSEKIAARSQARFDWRMRFDRAGETKLTVAAQAGVFSDAMERKFIVYEHGIEQLIARSGKLSAESGVVRFDMPGLRRAGSTSLRVTLSPSLAVTMLDSLPYLIDYPYGCVEQTMSRFLPSVVVAKTLADLGLDPKSAMERVLGGVEGEYSAKTHPKGARSLELLDEIGAASLARIYEFQHPDGGFGWWRDGDSERFMTGYVLWGLTLAREAGVEVRWGVAQRAAAFLDAQLVECEKRPDEAAWLLHALGQFAQLEGRASSEFEARALDRLWSQRDALNAYTRALAALAMHDFGLAERARTLVDNLVNGVRIDRTPDASLVMRGGAAANELVVPTAHWGRDGVCWRWSDGAVESTATVVRALLAIDPSHELVEPAVNWLVKNRRGAQWSNTRDTAITVLSLCEHLRRTGVAPDAAEFELRVNGAVVPVPVAVGVGALAAPSSIVVDPALVRDGVNEVEIRRTKGDAPAYFAVEARCFNIEEPIRAAGSELFVRRQYFALIPRDTLLSGVVYERAPIADGASVASGTRIETVLTIEAKNDLEYVVFEDLKPGGFEAVDTVSGDGLWASQLREDAVGAQLLGDPRTAAERFTGERRWAYRELRDRKVAVFVSRLPQGTWELSYTLRAEAPGEFHALPLLGQAMYAPEIRGNDREQVVVVQ